MAKRPTLFPLIPLTPLLLLVIGTSLSGQTPKTADKTALFAIWPAEKGKTPDAPLLDPIVVLSGMRFQATPDGHTLDRVWDAFQKTHYEAGKKYPVLIAGSADGTATVQEATSISCVSLMATVALSRPLPDDRVRLAASSLTRLGVHANRDPEVTKQDRARFLDLASAYLKEKGVTVAPSRVKINGLYSISLRADAPDALVGSITYETKSSIRHLFLLANKVERDYEIDLANYRVAKDVEDHTDDVDEDFVDHVDLDKDAYDEIITMMHYYESWNYNIYRKENGKWKLVYNGGGGGC